MTAEDKAKALWVIGLIQDFYLPSIRRHNDGGGDHTREIWHKIHEVIKNAKEDKVV